MSDLQSPPVINLQDAGFTYAKTSEAVSPYGKPVAAPIRATSVSALQGLDLECRRGTLTLLCGASGCGKSTVLRLLNGLIPHFHPGEVTGSITVAGKSVPDTPISALGQDCATVFQNPRTQFFTSEVLSELAFRGENYGLAPEVILENATQAAARLGVTDLLDARLTQLSGGQLQKIACASALASRNRILLFDEPTSNLSAQAIEEFTALLRELLAQDYTLVVAEHRLYFLRDLTDQVLLLENGRVIRRVTGQQFFALSDEQRRELGLRKLQASTLADFTPARVEVTPRGEDGVLVRGEDGLVLRNLKFAYGKTPVLDIESAVIPAGKITVLTGANGAGKTTLARLLCGLAKPQKGSEIILAGQARKAKELTHSSYLVMQDVNRQLFSESVETELGIGVKASLCPQQRLQALQAMDLENLASRHPLSLSGGQKQRLVIACAMVQQKSLYVFDEPTSGVDYRHLLSIAAEIRNLADSGATVLVITHDPEFIETCADYVAQLRPLSSGDSGPQMRLFRGMA